MLIEVEQPKKANGKIFATGDVIYSTENKEFLIVEGFVLNDEGEEVLKLSRLLPSNKGSIHISESLLRAETSTISKGKSLVRYVHYPKSDYKLVIQKRTKGEY